MAVDWTQHPGPPESVALDIDVLQRWRMSDAQRRVLDECLRDSFDVPGTYIRTLGEQPRGGGGGPSELPFGVAIELAREIGHVLEDKVIELILIGGLAKAWHEARGRLKRKLPEVDLAEFSLTLTVDGARYALPAPPSTDEALAHIASDHASSDPERRALAKAWVNDRWQTYAELGRNWPDPETY